MIIDAHVHLIGVGGSVTQRVDALLHFADKLGIDKLIACLGDSLRIQPTAQDLTTDNEFVLAAVRHKPSRIIGFCYASPAYPEASLAQLDRYVAEGPMMGVKLWVCRRCHDPGSDPIVQRAVDLGVPVLQHTWTKVTGNMPTESYPEDLVELASRHPRAQFIMAHSGGEWQRGIRAVAGTPNIAVDLCGGNPEQGQTELAVRLLGAERVVYGSDAGGRSFASQLAKVLGARLSEADRSLVLGGNIARMIGL